MYPLIVRCGNCDNSASTQTNAHDSQSQSPGRFIRARRLIHHRNAALAARNRGAADRRPPPTHPYSPGTRARSPDSFVKTSSTHNTRPSRDARIVSLIASRVASTPRVRARGSRRILAIRDSPISSLRPPLHLHRARTHQISQEISLHHLSQRSARRLRAHRRHLAPYVSEYRSFSLSSTTRNTPPRRRPRPPFTTRRVAIDDTNFLARRRALSRAFARRRARVRRRGVTTTVGPRRVSRRSRARGPIQTRISRRSRSVGHTRARGLGDECGLKRCPRVTTARQSKRAVGVPRMKWMDARRDERRTTTRVRERERVRERARGNDATGRGTSV